MNKIYLISCGVGEYIFPSAFDKAEECSCLIGGMEQLNKFNTDGKMTIEIHNNISEITDFISNNREKMKIGVLVSGDAGFYSMLDVLGRKFPNEEIEVVPGISSVQYLFSKLKKSWHNAQFCSAHGKPVETVIEAVKRSPLVATLTDTVNTPQSICKILINMGAECAKITVGENLGGKDENIVSGSVYDIADMEPFGTCVMVIENEG